MRHTATSGSASHVARGGDFEPGGGKGGSFSFQGNRLVGTIPYDSGVRQITATFDPGFSSCTASIIEGKAAGGVIRRKAPNGEMVEISNGTTSAQSCSIQNGSAFAQ